MTDKKGVEPKELFQQAEALRKANKPEEAQRHYQQVVRNSEIRSRARGESAANRADQVRRTLRRRAFLFLIIPLLVLGIAFAAFRCVEDEFAEKHTETDPKSYQFVEWLASQQMKAVLNNIVAANPELSFDFGRSAGAPMTPQETLQTLMRPGVQARIRSQKGDAPEGKGQDGEGDGPAKFVCSIDPTPNCATVKRPSAPGKARRDLAMLVHSYRSVLDNEHDCDKLVGAIELVGEKIRWRRSEAQIKSDLEQLALSCYARQKKTEKVIEQARKLQCSGDAATMNTSYWHLTASYYQQGRLTDAKRMYTCFRETVSHLTTHEFEPWQIAARHRESGALAWLYFNDLDTAVDELKTARSVLQAASGKSPSLKIVAAEVDLDLMETYVTANIDLQTFNQLHDAINTSGLLTDGYKQIKDTLAGIYYLQNGKNKQAIVALENVAARFKHLPEYICSWDWSGFQRGLKDSISDPMARKYAEQLVVATDCYVAQSIETRINSVQRVLQWLRRR
ncbi:MAG: hypothetical protein CSB47_08940 [Proteobacteria bacterium]|nr:MAG: hypothetical protein CSB47_08940 [Pseudomonadota bacterium]